MTQWSIFMWIFIEAFKGNYFCLCRGLCLHSWQLWPLRMFVSCYNAPVVKNLIQVAQLAYMLSCSWLNTPAGRGRGAESTGMTHVWGHGHNAITATISWSLPPACKQDLMPIASSSKYRYQTSSDIKKARFGIVAKLKQNRNQESIYSVEQ